jgi:hypothetical protein
VAKVGALLTAPGAIQIRYVIDVKEDDLVQVSRLLHFDVRTARFARDAQDGITLLEESVSYGVLVLVKLLRRMRITARRVNDGPR